MRRTEALLLSAQPRVLKKEFPLRCRRGLGNGPLEQNRGCSDGQAARTGQTFPPVGTAADPLPGAATCAACRARTVGLAPTVCLRDIGTLW